MRSTDACSWQIRSPKGVARSFQVSAYKVEPAEARFASNLFTKQHWRTALLDELEPGRPKVAFILYASAFAGIAERLAGTGTSPDGNVSWKSGESKRVVPDTNPGEGVKTINSDELRSLQIFDTALIDTPSGDEIFIREISKALSGEWIDLVVEDIHAAALNVPQHIFWSEPIVSLTNFARDIAVLNELSSSGVWR